MIHKISIENFYSIADKQELIFEVPGTTPARPCFKPSRSNESIRLPAVVGFFGPNASGKTTVLHAIFSVVFFLGQSVDLASINPLFQPYRQKKWWDRPTKILIDFDCQLGEGAPPALFRYELYVAHQGNNLAAKKIIEYEALSYAPKGKFRNLFKRKGQTFVFGAEFNMSGENDPRKEAIRPDASVISTLAKFNHALSIYLQTVITVLSNIAIKGLELPKIDILSSYARDQTCLNQLNRELRRFDVGIESMSIEQSNHGIFAKFKHTGLDGDIYLQEESRGTQQFIEIFPQLHYVLERGGIAIIDEIDSVLHPLLLPELFRWFNDPTHNPRRAQLFFTAHNPALLEDLEKEQVFFTEKLNGKPSHIYRASDIQGLRREPSLMRKYMSGELGAVPHIG